MPVNVFTRIQKWLRDPATKLDVIVMDSLHNECAYGLAHHFKAQLVTFNTGQVYPWELESYRGLPDETSSIPDTMLTPPTQMSFLQRVVNAGMPLVWKAFREMWYLPRLEAITKKGLGVEVIPSFREMEQNVSLHLMNNYWAQEYPRSLPPNVIPVGGIAFSTEGQNKQSQGWKELPRHLAEFIERGKDGFIFISFGSMGEFTKFDPEIRQAFIKTAEKFLDIQFILKSTYPVQEKLPGNVLVEKWLPQKQLLSHPKIRLFVTHGGLGGIYEAVYSSLPMLCFPLFTDQEYNADLMERKGYGIKLELTTLTETELTLTITKMLNDPSYQRQVEKVSKLLTDRPIHPLDLAVWWLEFILRHETAQEFIRPLSVTQPWWVRRQLDVWASILLSIVVIGAIGGVIFSKTIRFISTRIKKVLPNQSKIKNN